MIQQKPEMRSLRLASHDPCAEDDGVVSVHFALGAIANVKEDSEPGCSRVFFCSTETVSLDRGIMTKDVSAALIEEGLVVASSIVDVRNKSMPFPGKD